ncbi:MAG: IPT/TIG domain-containing protein [Bryobacteraceae bacterium]
MIRKIHCAALLSWASLVTAQQVAAPVSIGPSNLVLPPAVDASGQTTVFGSIIPPGSSDRGPMDVYVARIDSKTLRRLTQLQGSNVAIGATAVAESPDGSKAAYTSMIPSNGKTSEEVHVVNTSTLMDTKVAVDTEGCIQPSAALCLGCAFPCLHTPHFTADATKVLYTSSRNQPFFVVNVDGTNAARLPVYSGSLAPAAQRVVSRNGLIVFTSSAVNGPTLAASPTDVFVMNLDGSNVRAVTHFNDKDLFARNAVITADGSSVVFLSNLNGDLQSGVLNLFIARVDGSSLRQLTSGIADIASFSLSADGTRLAYIQGGQVYLLSTVGESAPVALTNLQRSAASDVVISDDGSRILCTVGPAQFGTAAIASISMSPFGRSFELIYAPRSISVNGIVGLGNFVAPSPGSFFTIYGTNFAPDELQTANRLPLPKSLGGISVTVNGEPVPVQAVTPWQVNAQLPQSTPAGQAAIQLQFNDGTPLSGTAQVQSAAPDVFFYHVPGPGITSGYDQAAAYHAGTAVPADMTHPAAVGETLEFYGTGLGATDPMVEAGTASGSNPVSKAVATPEVQIGGIAAKVAFAGLTPGFVGLYQVNAAVPPGLKSGRQPVVWVSGENRRGGGVIWVQ